ncbi:hypothetical protein JXA40_11270 [bacterium]|nr:hypothetical protein [candidate division CSSED10-310 bacterium]
MKYAGLILIVGCLISVPGAGGCENDREVGGYFWTFHRMDDGNSYHECRLGKIIREGTSVVLSAPCDIRFVEALQVDWTDNRGKMKAELFVSPGNHRMGIKDVSDDKRQTWTIGSEVNQFEFKFTGPRDKKARINWIRVFYGKNASRPSGHQGRSLSDDLQSITTPDKIKFKKGPDERPCRVMSWNGRQLVIIVDRGGGNNVRREVEPELVDTILFSHRWGTATGTNNLSVPFKAKRFQNNLLWFDKKEGDKIISKEQYPIEKFSRIDFNQ